MIILFIYFLMMSIPVLQAQDQPLTVDEQFDQARDAAFNDGNYDKARTIAYAALERSPDYHGIRLFIARLYGWEGDYASARNELETVLNRDPDNRKAFEALINIESRSGDLDRSLSVTDRALEIYPRDEEFLLQRASVLYSFDEFVRSEQVYRSILLIHPSSREARDGLESARLKQMKHSVSLSYRHDQFDQIFEPWNFWEMQLNRQTPYGSAIGRLQYANRFSQNGVQFNLDTYPSITSGFYAYLSGGFSNSSIYPRFRFGFSLYKSLPFALELEGGIRYLNFTTSETYIYTASLTKYRGNYMFTGRSYFAPSSLGNSLSGNLLIRRYFSSADSYVSISGGYGTASNDIQFAQEINTLNSWSLSFDAQYPLSNRFLVSGKAGIDSEEFRSYTRRRVSIKARVSYRF
ncbi:YaiO family outer membrane beta-barrel protein [Rhodohalobacter sp. 8-1]|uniref:YaiO family outer membrane beta-barrel protein n=1 Tax=Rhodohalobacter sp. 8-1 TaxID=3131972 RepID=UPI0030EB1D69